MTEDPEAEVQAALLGLAYAQLPNYLVRPHIRSGHSFFVVSCRRLDSLRFAQRLNG